MTERDWDKELAKIDKQLDSISDQETAPPETAPVPAPPKGVAPERAVADYMPAIVRLVLAVALGVGVLFWPYDNRCGSGLAGYLAVVAVLMASGVWSAVWTWRHRTGRAHTLSILLIVWGLALGATEVLPRIGYAKQALPWSCTP